MARKPTAQPDVAARFLSISEVCATLGLARKTVYDRVLPNVTTLKIGNRRLVEAESLRHWLVGQRVSGGGVQ